MEADDHLTRQFVLRCRALLGRWEDGKLVPYSFREKQMLLFRAISLTVLIFVYRTSPAICTEWMS